MDHLDRYNVVWDSPSKDASGSMPIGNGDFAANVWVEGSSGDLILLLSKSDAWDENSTLLKLGRVRIALSPSAFAARLPLRVELRLRTADIEITCGGSRALVWVDAHDPVLHVEIETDTRTEVRAAVEIWRTEPRAIKTQTGDLFRDLNGKDPYPTIISPDHVFADSGDRIAWCHHNAPRQNDGYEINLKLQGLGELVEKLKHPLRGRTFGASMRGDGFITVGPLTLKSSRAKWTHELTIHALTLAESTPEQWHEQIRSTYFAFEWLRREGHEAWWERFWNRSWIFVEAPTAFHVTQGYVLQRYMNACAGRGEQPIKFNGSLFTTGKPDDPDFRRWGGPGFWFMNTRLIYWPMFAAGDFDLLRVWARMYLDMLPLQRHRTRTYYGHGGAHFPETITFWGAEVSAHYGWTPFEQRKHPEAECSYVTYYWTCGIELTLMLWTYFNYTGDESFAREFLVPIADAVAEFFDVHYPRDRDAKIRFEPAQALETWQDATNPTPEIAGLRYVLPKLLELPEALTGDATRSRWRRMLSELPVIPTGEKDGRRVILPAERFDKLKNKENPELYPVFPFRLFGVNKPQIQLARDTFAARLHMSHECWSQDDIQAALLGLTETAKEFVTKRAAPASYSESRFPAFWNQFHDERPDMDHGGVLQLALQFMLMQCEGREIRLLPAWPKDWDADFRLHAPYETVVEGKIRGGEVVDLKVTPEDRRADVILPT